ncbi:T9SS type A sorting domain-containing protein [Mucilaginibacter limnophilus]|uniref:T9SS type A sorting domain-containing protein n=1 Tax=Mucilaginibacter limnophilus TaxID=1932778 RepID=A0A437MZ33_9SPHI|nr:glycoside hydrolase family 44 protein [Mucilaginibacter limnophilus]RVU02876.1 T9SS type A sorting domain-containing protein [Mucilaginibacter limnophilus]
MHSKRLLFVLLLFGFQGYAQVKVTFNVNTKAERKKISPLIYGTNDNYKYAAAKRLGGNRITNYNWENNASNAGRDWFHESDNYVPWEQGVDEGDYNVPGAAIKAFHTRSLQQNAFSLITLPMAKYVAADKNGAVSGAQTAPSNRWAKVKYQKPGAFSLTPDLTDSTVYNDEEINFLIHHFGKSNTSTGVKAYALDNEPGLWFDSHSRMWGPSHVPVTYLLDNSVALATRIKQMDPTAQVFGPASWGVSEFETLQEAPDWADVHGDYPTFIDYYLAKMEERGGSTRLLDVLDVHWYPQGRNDGLSPFDNSPDYATSAARMEMTRSLWDTTYRENTWIGTDGWKVEQFLPFIPKMKKHIDTYYPGTKLAITEYSYMGTGHPSGGIAQADALGTFGKLDLYLATYWGAVIDYIKSGFDLYRNYDGKGGQFGDISVSSSTNDIENSSVYASIESANESRTHIIAMNKNQDGPIVATININGDKVYKSARVWAFDRSSSTVRQIRNIRVIENNKFEYTIPPLTACHIVLTEEDLSVFPDFDAVKVTPQAGWSDGTASFDIIATIYDGDKDIRKVTADLTPVGGPAAAPLKVISNVRGEYKLHFDLPTTAVSGLKLIKITAVDAKNHSGESSVQYRVIKKTESSLVWDADSVKRGVGEHFFDPADSIASQKAKIQRITTGGNNQPGSLFMHFEHAANKYNMMTWRISENSNPADGRDISDYGYIEFYIRSNAPAGSDIEFNIRDASAELATSSSVLLKRDGYLSAFSPTSYSRVRIPISALTAGSEVHLDQVWQFNFAANTASKGFDVWVDDIRVLPYSNQYKAPVVSYISQTRTSGYADKSTAVTVSATVKDPDNDLKSVTIDLSEVNGPNNQPMTLTSANRYQWTFKVPESVAYGIKKLKINAKDALENEGIGYVTYKVEQVASNLLIWDGDTKNTGAQIQVNPATTTKVNATGGNAQPISLDIHLDKGGEDFTAAAWDWNEDTYNTELADLSDKRYLNFYLKMLTPVSDDFDMEVFVKDRFGNDPPGVKLKANGYVTSYTGDYQLVKVPLTELFGDNANIDKAQMTRVGWLSNQLSGVVDFKVDEIHASGSLVHDVKIKYSNPGCGTKGTITVDTVYDAAGPFAYYIDGAVNPSGMRNKKFGGLNAGKHIVRVTGPNGFVYMEEVTLKDVELTSTQIVTPGNAEVIVKGGSGNYTYAWSNGNKTQKLINVAAGTYTVKVTDKSNGCKLNVTVTVPPATLSETKATLSANKAVNTNTLNVYPNPVKGNGTLNLHYEFNDAAKRQITLRDFYGKLLYSTYITEATGNLSISLPALRGGIYIIRNEGKDPASLKVLIQE